ncbi:MAG: YceI family protein [Oligoflexia bacterium]|nr:YceI family protein [Oligoflexia bacterium]MBF0364288.1 YceI family protein [Oligoflexia bacterium]
MKTQAQLKTTFQFLLFLPLFFVMTSSLVAKEYTIASGESAEVKWSATKVGGGHSGSVAFQSAVVTMNQDVVTSGTFIVDMNKITCSDLTGAMAEKLLTHLKSKDFFHVEKFPTATLTIFSAKKGKNAGEYDVFGKLTIKGKTNQSHFTMILKEEGNKLTGTTTLTFDRTKYDIRYGSGKFFSNLGDKLIHDEVKLEIALSLTAK